MGNSQSDPGEPGEKSQTLLPCPFCGGEARLDVTVDGSQYMAMVLCTCGARRSVMHGARDKAIVQVVANWNTRPDAVKLEGRAGVLEVRQGERVSAVAEICRAIAAVATSIDRMMAKADICMSAGASANATEIVMRILSHCALLDELSLVLQKAGQTAVVVGAKGE